VATALPLVFGAAYLADRLAPGEADVVRTAEVRGAERLEVEQEGSPFVRWAKVLLRMVVLLVPEYLVVVLLVGAAQAFVFPHLEFSSLGAGGGILLALWLAVAGTLFVIPTAGEIPIVQTLTAAGLGPLGAGVLFTTLPAISLPSLVMAGWVFPKRVLASLALWVALMGLVRGWSRASWRWPSASPSSPEPWRLPRRTSSRSPRPRQDRHEGLGRIGECPPALPQQHEGPPKGKAPHVQAPDAPVVTELARRDDAHQARSFRDRREHGGVGAELHGHLRLLPGRGERLFGGPPGRRPFLAHHKRQPGKVVRMQLRTGQFRGGSHHQYELVLLEDPALQARIVHVPAHDGHLDFPSLQGGDDLLGVRYANVQLDIRVVLGEVHRRARHEHLARRGRGADA
jgi:hypothetical protein